MALTRSRVNPGVSLPHLPVFAQQVPWKLSISGNEGLNGYPLIDEQCQFFKGDGPSGSASLRQR